MYEIGIVGAKNSGKTTLLELLIPALKAHGIRAATVKHTGHAHIFDTEGKDTLRHRRAGSVATIARSGVEIALFADSNEQLFARLRDILSELCSICLVEGDKGSHHPKILLTRNLERIKGKIPDNIIASYGDLQFRNDVLHFGLNQVDSLTEHIIRLAGGAGSVS